MLAGGVLFLILECDFKSPRDRVSRALVGALDEEPEPPLVPAEEFGSRETQFFPRKDESDPSSIDPFSFPVFSFGSSFLLSSRAFFI